MPDAPNTNKPTADGVDEYRMPFTEHLEELRHCLIRSLLGLAVTATLSLIYARDILSFIIRPAIVVLQANGESPNLLSLSPSEPFMLTLKVAILAGMVLAAPWLLYQLWAFVSVGLYANERKFVKSFLPVSIVLFFVGVLFMYYIVLPVVLSFLVKFSQGFDMPDVEPNAFQRLIIGEEPPTPAEIDAQLDLQIPILNTDPQDPPTGSIWFNSQSRKLYLVAPEGEMFLQLTPVERERVVASQYSLQFFVTFVFTLAIGFGLAFEMPVVVVFLAATGIVSAATMAGARRYVLFGVVVFGAVLTPPDIASQIMLALPMYALFEAGLIAARRFDTDD
jgi:sec-independent protein translocase protein TatC